MTRRELDTKLRDLENGVRHLMAALPAMANDIAALREQLNVTEPAAPPPAPEPEQQALGME